MRLVSFARISGAPVAVVAENVNYAEKSENIAGQATSTLSFGAGDVLRVFGTVEEVTLKLLGSEPEKAAPSPADPA